MVKGTKDPHNPECFARGGTGVLGSQQRAFRAGLLEDIRVEVESWGGGSGGNVFATQAGGPELGSPAPLEKARAVVCTCDSPVTHVLGR